VLNGPAIYTGTLRHRRFRPRRHEFTYSLFMAMLDIDRIPEAMQVSPAASYNRFNWAAFVERDHFGDPGKTLRQRVEADAASHGVKLPGGPIYLLTHLRYLGYCFNPISLFYCCDGAGKVQAVLAEVNSTFGESRNYWLDAAKRLESANSLRYRTAKTMHVSPFMPMELDYDFTLTEPEERLVAHMETLDGGHPLFDATLTLKREEWSAKNLHGALARLPWMTAKVMAAIHWEALRLWAKRVPVFTHPARAARGNE
jgi:DUF1365 family protein